MSVSWNTLATHLLELANTSEEQGRMLDGLESVQELCQSQVRVSDILGDATTLLANRLESLRGAMPELSSFVLVAMESLLQQDALEDLPDLIEALVRIRSERGWGKDLDVTSAIPLSAEDLGRVRAMAESKWQMPVRLRVKLDPQIIGGLKFATRDWELDATVHGRLQSLAHHLHTSLV